MKTHSITVASAQNKKNVLVVNHETNAVVGLQTHTSVKHAEDLKTILKLKVQDLTVAENGKPVWGSFTHDPLYFRRQLFLSSRF